MVCVGLVRSRCARGVEGRGLLPTTQTQTHKGRATFFGAHLRGEEEHLEGPALDGLLQEVTGEEEHVREGGV